MTGLERKWGEEEGSGGERRNEYKRRGRDVI